MFRVLLVNLYLYVQSSVGQFVNLSVYKYACACFWLPQFTATAFTLCLCFFLSTVQSTALPAFTQNPASSTPVALKNNHHLHYQYFLNVRQSQQSDDNGRPKWVGELKDVLSLWRARLQRVETDQIKVKSDLAALTGRVTKIETRLTTVESNAKALEGRTTAVEKRTTDVETRATAVETRTTAVENKATAVETRTTAVEKRTTAVENKAATVETRTNALETKTSNIQSSE